MAYLIAGYDETVRYQRVDSSGAVIQPSISGVTAKLDGVTVSLSETPTWDATNECWLLVILGSEKPTSGELVLTWAGSDSEMGSFSDPETYVVLPDDSDDAVLLYNTRQFLRLDASDPTVPALVAAAREYITNAGVTAPAVDADGWAQYELAVKIYVSTIFSGGESKLQDAMTAILWQLRA